MSSDDEGVTHDMQAARDEIRTLRNQGVATQRERPDLYQRAFPEPAEGAAPAPRTVLTKDQPPVYDVFAPRPDPAARVSAVEQATARLAAMKRDPTHPSNDALHPDHAAGVEERAALYRVLYPPEAGEEDAAPAPDAGEGPIEPDVPAGPDLPGGERWHEPARVAAYDAGAAVGLGRGVIDAVLAKAVALVAEGTVIDPEWAAAEYEQRWGARADGIIADAQRVYDYGVVGLPERERTQWNTLLEKTGLRDDPDFIELLAQRVSRLTGAPARKPPADEAEEGRWRARAYQRIHGSR